MNPYRYLYLNQWLLCGLLFITPGSRVFAALGQSPTLSLATNAVLPQTLSNKKMAFAPVVASGLYTVHETQLESGTSVREFATPVGVVFAVAWRGPVLPDLGNLLGNYFDTFKLEIDQARATGRRGGPVNIQRADLVVQSNGRMRNFFGHAFAPTLIPAGVNVNDLLR